MLELVVDCRVDGKGWEPTIWRPLMPTMKSNHGSIGMSSFLLRRTWNPKDPWPSVSREGESESRREMKRFSAPNIVGSDWNCGSLGLWCRISIPSCEEGRYKVREGNLPFRRDAVADRWS